MASKNVEMRAGNKGLTVKINLWALEKYLDGFNAEAARLWIKGHVTHADSKETLMFNDAGELISILGKWNSAQYKELKRKASGSA